MKTSELTGPALDWAVAKCEGLLCFGYRTDGKRFAVEDNDGQLEGFMPSTNWEDGGPIIERMGINIIQSGSWLAEMDADHSGGVIRAEGSTPLIAAMRCYVASKLGDEVDVPRELT